MKGRSRKILDRFPAHFEAVRPGKQFGVVTDALVTNLDEESAIMARIRRAHRLQDADELRDLLQIGALHGITLAELALVFVRFELAAELILKLSKATSAEDRDTTAEALCDLWAIDLPHPRLPVFVLPQTGHDLDLNLAKADLLTYASAANSRARLLDAVRDRIAKISMIHAAGNGTIGAMLEGAANALDLDAINFFHSSDRFWHAVTVHDRLNLMHAALVPASGSRPARVVSEPLPTAAEVVAIEENPIERISIDPIPRHHGEFFSVSRRGFERVPLQVQIEGIETKTVGPMIVNRDEGHGIGYAAPVPAGSKLVFTEEGRALLDGADVTSSAYSWKGACFAEEASRHPADFIFDGPGIRSDRRAHFAEADPAGALDPDFVFPHSGESVEAPGVEVGETRFAFFIQLAYFSHVTEAESVDRVAPRTAVGFFDDSVFSSDSDQPGTRPGAAIVLLSWLEHRPFCVRVLIPHRFSGLAPTEDPEGLQIRQGVAQALKRFQPAGVEIRVEFIDDRWVLGLGTLFSSGSIDPTAQFRSSMVLWSEPAD